MKATIVRTPAGWAGRQDPPPDWPRSQWKWMLNEHVTSILTRLSAPPARIQTWWSETEGVTEFVSLIEEA